MVFLRNIYNATQAMGMLPPRSIRYRVRLPSPSDDVCTGVEVSQRGGDP